MNPNTPRNLLILGLTIILLALLTKIRSMDVNDKYCDNIIDICNITNSDGNNYWYSLTQNQNNSTCECQYPFKGVELSGWVTTYCVYDPLKSCPRSNCDDYYPNRPGDYLEKSALYGGIVGLVIILISVCLTRRVNINVEIRSPMTKFIKFDDKPISGEEQNAPENMKSVENDK